MEADKMLVLRIENEHGRGPYMTDEDECPDPPLYDTASWARPLPAVEGLDEWEGRYIERPDGSRAWVCHTRHGFVDMEQLHRWFDAPRLRLCADAGYFLAQYEAENVRVGKAQVLFHAQHAELVSRRPLEDAVDLPALNICPGSCKEGIGEELDDDDDDAGYPRTLCPVCETRFDCYTWERVPIHEVAPKGQSIGQSCSPEAAVIT